MSETSSAPVSRTLKSNRIDWMLVRSTIGNEERRRLQRYRLVKARQVANFLSKRASPRRAPRCLKRCLLENLLDQLAETVHGGSVDHHRVLPAAEPVKFIGAQGENQRVDVAIFRIAADLELGIADAQSGQRVLRRKSS